MSFSEHRLQPVSLLSPTVLELDDAMYRQAQRLSNVSSLDIPSRDEPHQWQHYLKALGLLAFQTWLKEHGLDTSLATSESGESFHILQIGEFRCCVIVIENCLSERVTLPVEWVQARAAHFYVVLEVAEEEDQVWFRGLIRQDQLREAVTWTTETVTLPFTACEPELNRLLHYCQYLDPQAIQLPLSSMQTPVSVSSPINAMRVQLSAWFEHVIAEGWQAWDALQPQLTYATRGLSEGMRQGKLVNLGLEVGSHTVALILTLKQEANDKISILVQLLPTGGDRTLPPNIELSMLSRQGAVVQSVNSRRQDNYIQLKRFQGLAGQQFSLQIKLGEVIMVEDFEI